MRKGQKITLKDIALETGFTVNTVSRALKDKDDISEATKKLIVKKANEMGYIPNSIAGALRSGKTKTIAVILGDISNPYFAITVKEIENALNENEYNTFLLNTDERYDLEKRAIFSAMSKNVDGIILFPTQHSSNDIKILKSHGIPFILLGRHFYDEDTDYVVTDDIKGGYLATQHLLERGHRNILILKGKKYISAAKERLDGYKKALSESNIDISQELIKEISIISGECHQVVKKVIQEGNKFTAIFAFSDMVAWEAIYQLEKMNYRIPQDIAVVGYDNIQSRFYIPIPLTTINIPKREMTRKAVEVLLEKIAAHGQRWVYRHEVFDVKLVVRKTT